MVLKIPPPPFLTGKQYAGFNRWLLEFVSIFNSGGFIDPSQVGGLPELIAQVAQNVTDITTLEDETASNTTDIGNINDEIVALQAQTASLQNQINALSKVLNGIIPPVGGVGNVGDWYADTVGLHIYVKTTLTVWTMII